MIIFLEALVEYISIVLPWVGRVRGIEGVHEAVEVSPDLRVG